MPSAAGASPAPSFRALSDDTVPLAEKKLGANSRVFVVLTKHKWQVCDLEVDSMLALWLPYFEIGFYFLGCFIADGMRYVALCEVSY